MNERVSLIIVAAGSGQRFGSPAKVLVELAGEPALARLLRTVAAIDEIDEIVLVGSADLCGAINELAERHLGDRAWRVVHGGSRRQDSVAIGLAATDADVVVVHDGARPLASPELFRATISAVAAGADAAVATSPLTDTLKQVDGNRIIATLDRSMHALAQTPQAFRRTRLVEALEYAETQGVTVTDEATLIEQMGGGVAATEGARTNMKLTVQEDLRIMEALVTPSGHPRTGIGYDVHRLVSGRPLVLGGVQIPFARGLDGHSDADVLLHAIADAVLGSWALGDIGRHFPPSDPAFKGIDSRQLLSEVRRLLHEAGGEVVGVDATVAAEAPKLAPHTEAMRGEIASCLAIPIAAVSVKATTNEALGFVGRAEGIAALAIATVAPRS